MRKIFAILIIFLTSLIALFLLSLNSCPDIRVVGDLPLTKISGDKTLIPVFQQYLKDDKVACLNYYKNKINNYEIFLQDVRNKKEKGNIVGISFIYKYDKPTNRRCMVYVIDCDTNQIITKIIQ